MKSRSKQSLLIAADAQPNLGGMGLNLAHLIGGLERDFEITLLSAAPMAGVRGNTLPPSDSQSMQQRLYSLMGRTDRNVLKRTRAFDEWVKQMCQQHPAEFLLAAVGQCFDSLNAFRQNGGKYVVLDAVNHHVEEFREHVDREQEAFGVATFLLDEIVERTLESYQSADTIRVMSQRSKLTFLEAGISEDKLVIATPAVDVSRFPSKRTRSNYFRVGYGGQIVPWKGFHYLVNAFRRFQPPEARLTFWGYTGARQVRRYFSDTIRADNRITINNVTIAQHPDQVFGETDVWVHPSLSDGYAYSAVEAMAAGIPTIVSENTGCAQLIEDGRNGFIVPIANSQAIEERLDYLYHNQNEALEIGARARQTVASHTENHFRSQLLSCFPPKNRKRQTG